jgi:hypothetical protein
VPTAQGGRAWSQSTVVVIGLRAGERSSKRRRWPHRSGHHPFSKYCGCAGLGIRRTSDIG